MRTLQQMKWLNQKPTACLRALKVLSRDCLRQQIGKSSGCSVLWLDERETDWQLLCQCGSTYSCLSRWLPDIHCRPAYPSVFDCIRREIGWQYGCMPIFLKIWTESFQKVWKTWREQMRVRCQQSRSLGVDGVIVHWHLNISSHFRGWSIQPILTGEKSFWTNEHRFCIQSFAEVSRLQIWRVWIRSSRW